MMCDSTSFRFVEASICPVCNSPYINIPFCKVQNRIETDEDGQLEMSGPTAPLDEYPYHCSACHNDSYDTVNALLIWYNSKLYTFVFGDVYGDSYVSISLVPHVVNHANGNILLLPKQPEEILYISPVDDITEALVDKIYEDDMESMKQAFQTLLSLADDPSSDSEEV